MQMKSNLDDIDKLISDLRVIYVHSLMKDDISIMHRNMDFYIIIYIQRVGYWFKK